MRFAFWMSLILVAVSGGVWAQDSAISSGNASRIGVLDMEPLMNDSSLGKEYAAKIEKLQKEIQDQTAQKQTELAQMEEDLRKMREQLEKDRALLSAEALEERQYEISKAARKREVFVQDTQVDLQRRQRLAEQKVQELNRELREKMVPFVKEVILAKQLDIVIDRRYCVSVSRDREISGDVIARADKAYSNAKQPAE